MAPATPTRNQRHDDLQPTLTVVQGNPTTPGMIRAPKEKTDDEVRTAATLRRG